LARAHSRLLVALESGSEADEDVVAQLAHEAAELLVAVARAWAGFGSRAVDRRGALVDMLRRRLGSHEDAVLAGEVTYSVWSEQAEEPAVRMRQARASATAQVARQDKARLAAICRAGCRCLPTCIGLPSRVRRVPDRGVSMPVCAIAHRCSAAVASRALRG
jgi:hypothetical protein